MGWTIGVGYFAAGPMKGFHLFATAFMPALGPTQPPTRWVLGAFSVGAKRPRREVDH